MGERLVPNETVLSGTSTLQSSGCCSWHSCRDSRRYGVGGGPGKGEYFLNILELSVGYVAHRSRSEGQIRCMEKAQNVVLQDYEDVEVLGEYAP
jgi:hypothetical protein